MANGKEETVNLNLEFPLISGAFVFHNLCTFNNIFAKPLEVVNLSALNAFSDGDTVTAEALLEKGVLSKCEYGFKVLGNGKLTKKVTVKANAFSASAKEAIEAAGGKAEVK